jgi:hypothetical protein
MTCIRDDPGGWTQAPDLSAMRSKVLSDFASGRTGQRHNTFQHRLRILRQLGGGTRSLPA